MWTNRMRFETRPIGEKSLPDGAFRSLTVMSEAVDRRHRYRINGDGKCYRKYDFFVSCYVLYINSDEVETSEFYKTDVEMNAIV